MYLVETTPQLDKDLLSDQYADFVDAVGRYADALSYASAGLGPSDAPRMAPILRRCTALTSLDLSANPALNDDGATALADALDGALPALKELDFRKNPV